MELSVRREGDVVVIGLDGRLDSRSAPSVEEQLAALLADHRVMLMDLGRMSYLSSAGLRVLLLLYRQAQAAGSAVVLARVPAEVEEIMAATGFLSFFTVADTVDGALQQVAP